MQADSVILVRNPVSGRGAGTKKWALVERLMVEAGLAYSVLTTEGPGHARELAHSAAQAETGTVVACGGDGTVGDVAGAIVGTKVRLGVLPLGTGNDFARHFGLADLNSAVAAIRDGQEKKIDLIRWEIGDQRGYAINVCGAGFDAVVAERINVGFRGLKGTTAYIAAVLDTLRTFRSVEIGLTVDGQTIQERGMLCAVANASSYGGGMRIAPDASTDDGLLDVVLIGGVSKAEFLRTFPSVFKGRHLAHPAVNSWKARRVEISSNPPLPVLCDGELRGVTPAVFEVIPGAITLIVAGVSFNKKIIP